MSVLIKEIFCRDTDCVFDAILKGEYRVVMMDYDGVYGESSDHIDPSGGMFLKPGLVESGYLERLDKMRSTGVRTCIVTNQPVWGHVVAEIVSQMGRRYEYFPQCFIKRGVQIFGSGFDWPVPSKRRKNIRNIDGLKEVCDWVMRGDNGVTFRQMSVAFVGDRRDDLIFLRSVVGELKDRGVRFGEVDFYKIPGFFDKIDNFTVKLVRTLGRLIP